MVLVCSFVRFQCLVPQMWVLAFAWKLFQSLWKTIEINETQQHCISLFFALYYIQNSLIGKLQNAILINTASSTSRLEFHSSKGMIQWCLGWGHGPGEKRFSSHIQMIKLSFCIWFSEKHTLIYIVIFILWKSVKRNLILTGSSFLLWLNRISLKIANVDFYTFSTYTLE